MSHVGHYQTPVGPEKIVVLEVGRQIDVGFRSGRGLDQRGLFIREAPAPVDRATRETVLRQSGL